VKLWATNGTLATILVVMAQVPKSDGHRGGITAFVVESESDGVTVERRNAFLGLRGLENSVTPLPSGPRAKENVIGKEGQGLKIALTTLNTGRLSLPASCVGASKWCLAVAREWSTRRVQVGTAGRRPRGGRPQDRLHRRHHLRHGVHVGPVLHARRRRPQRHQDRSCPREAVREREGLADR
jgi:alkylation response protein AidB-like acyl-CoA dehydrogenase